MARKDPFVEPKRLSSVAPASDLTPLDDLAERDLLLKEMTPATSSRFGPEREGFKVVLEEMDHSNFYETMVFGQVTARQLAKIDPADLPMVVRFVKSGRCWVIE